MSKLLLVEDDNNLREIYEARLQAEGYTIVTAKDGEEALVVAKAERPDLIISDIMMPKISGFEMLDILRNTENLKNVPVIMLTALGQNDDQQRADKLGADRYLVKSQVTLEDIVKVAHELLGDSPTAPTEAAPASTTQASTSTPPAPAAAPAPTTPSTDTPVAPPPAAAPASTPNPDPVATQPTTSPVSTTPSEPSIATPPDVSTTSSPEPVSESVIDNGTAATAAATTSAQEGADVDARIEDFVAGATQDAAPSSTASEISLPQDTAATDDSSTGPDDSVPAAVDEPVSTDTSPAAEKPTETPREETSTPVKTTAPADAEPASPETPKDAFMTTEPGQEAADTETTEPAVASNSPVVHDKVIKPLESDPKKDINTLLALETAKEAGNAPEPTASPVIVDASQVPAQPAPDPATPSPKELGTTKPMAPNTVITPVETEQEDEDTASASPVVASTTPTPTVTTPAIAPPSSAITQPGASEEPGTDLNSIAL
jgi:CheY-like chemotaxis protein